MTSRFPKGISNAGTWKAAALLIAVACTACGGRADYQVVVTNTIADAGSSGGCVGNTSSCGTSCVELDVDPFNCGACGHACAAAEKCVAGACAVECQPSQALCPHGAEAACVSLATDNANCGACGNTCDAGEACSSGACLVTCAPPLTSCGAGLASLCTNVDADPQNCGACGVTCAADDVCKAGKCGAFCNNNVLLLGDQDSAGNANLVSALSDHGLVVTLVADGTVEYAGDPPPDTFGAIYIQADSYNGHSTMAPAGQTAVVGAWYSAGVGVVLSAATTYVEFADNNPTLAQLEIVRGSAFTSGQSVTEIVPSSMWGGLPASFTPVDTHALSFCIDCAVMNGATSIAKAQSASSVGVGILDGTARTVTLTAIVPTQNFNWASETNYVRLLANSLKWSAHCLE